MTHDDPQPWDTNFMEDHDESLFSHDGLLISGGICTPSSLRIL